LRRLGFVLTLFCLQTKSSAWSASLSRALVGMGWSSEAACSLFLWNNVVLKVGWIYVSSSWGGNVKRDLLNMSLKSLVLS